MSRGRWVLVSLCLSSCGGSVAPHLSRESLLSLRAGQSTQEVVQAIGYPLSVEAGGGGRVDHTTQAAPWPDYYRWVYVKPASPPFEGLAVTVTVRDGKVLGVYAKYNDEPFYEQSEARSWIRSAELLTQLPQRQAEPRNASRSLPSDQPQRVPRPGALKYPSPSPTAN